LPFNNLHLIAIERVADDKVVSVIALGGVRYSASGSYYSPSVTPTDLMASVRLVMLACLTGENNAAIQGHAHPVVIQRLTG